ncbi:ATP-binding protein [Chryseobacterium sp. GP-SGM7]|uniref:ATP-binding protein n=1 Tax=Chryseobacterium sp. GP-SGM7 TaxID=3411323 RepID=UPI003B93BBEF
MADNNSSDEQNRLKALYSYDILDTATEKDFDELTELAAAICDTPISLISFVDKDRQWFKSHYGLDARQTDRCYSFCSHAIQNPDQLMQVEDAQNDIRFQDNPLVTGSPEIRFYAGIPLLDKDGYALGSLCVIDQKPKLLNETQQKALRTISHQVIDKLLLRKNNNDLILSNHSLTKANNNLIEAEERLKKAVTDLTESKERIQNILDIVGEGIGIADQKGNIIYNNRRNREIFQLDEKSVSTLSNISPEWNNRRLDGSQLPAEEHPITIALTTGIPVLDREFLISDQPGNFKCLRMNAMPIKDGNGNVSGAIGSFADITESYQLQENLKESEQSLRSAISSANLGTWRIQVQNMELFPSPRMKELFGFYNDEPMSFNAAIDQIAESHRQLVIDTIDSAISKDEPHELEYPIVGYRDKKLRWLRATFQIYKDQKNLNFSYLSGTVADITEKKLDEQRRTDFVGMVSHELRNPLAAIKGYVYILNRSAHKNNDLLLAENMSKVDNQVKRMENLINGFLDVAHLGEGKIRLEKNSFDIARLFKRTEEEFLAAITSHRVIFAPLESVPIEADQDKIEQVLVNFINNAIKYSPTDTVIKVICHIKDGWLKVSVKDQGMGIPLKDQSFIFDRFYRVENEATKNKKGFGMGLYICKEIIERHNGQIGVESAEGEGSTFWFSLPLSV